jgi:hypothetical protein
VIDRPQVGQSGAEGGCGYVVDGPPNIDFDARVKEWGFSGADVAAAVDGRHHFDLVWRPWYEDPPSAHPAMRSLTVEISAQHKARLPGCGFMEVIADVRVRDDASGIEVALPGKLQASAPEAVTGGDGDPLPDAGPNRDTRPHLQDVFMRLRFDSPELAAALALPAADADADAGADADPFDLDMDWFEGDLSASLSSVRDSSNCYLLVPPGTDGDVNPTLCR